MDITKIKIAIVHDWLVTYGGAEKVIKTILEIFPQADLYTLVYDERKIGNIFPKNKVKTSIIQKIPFSTKLYTKLLPFMPFAIEEFNFTGYDLVISSSTCCAKGIITPPDTLHISYVNSPMRYAWDLYHDYRRRSGFLTKIFMSLFMKNIRIWDITSSQRIDKILANSYNVAKRIKKYWKRESTVIYPPVELERLRPNGKEPEEFYIAFSRLVYYKRIDLAIEACKNLKRKLIVIGDGEERKNLEKIANKNENIIFVGRLSDEEIMEYLQKCKALIFCAEEDFGIIPVEVQACGRPVIAFGKGGALETVIDGKTGVLFKEQTVTSLTDAIKKLDNLSFDQEELEKNVQRFSRDHFEREIKDFIISSLEQQQVGRII